MMVATGQRCSERLAGCCYAWSEQLWSRIEVVAGVNRGRVLSEEDLGVSRCLREWVLDERWWLWGPPVPQLGRGPVYVVDGHGLDVIQLCCVWVEAVEGSMIRMCVLGFGVVESL